MAAHLEGRGCGMIDMAGLAQKGGAVFSHVKLARAPQDIHAIRIAPGGADLILGCDLVVSGSRAVLSTVNGAKTGVVVNAAEVFPGDFTRNPDFSLPTERLKRAIQSAAGGEAKFVDATAAAVAALGNSIGANMFVLGYAYQAGLVPLSSAAIRRAIELNGEAVEMNLAAFAWGRAACANPASVAGFARAPEAGKNETLAEVVAKRAEFLAAYQNRAYAERYKALVEEVAKAEQAKAPGRSGLALARCALRLQGHGLQGRIRGRAALYGRLVRAGGRRGLRGRSETDVSSRPADPRPQGPAHGPAAQDGVRAVDDARVLAAGGAQGPARRRLRRVRLQRGAARGAQADRGLFRARARADRPSSTPAITASR